MLLSIVTYKLGTTQAAEDQGEAFENKCLITQLRVQTDLSATWLQVHEITHYMKWLYIRATAGSDGTCAILIP